MRILRTQAKNQVAGSCSDGVARVSGAEYHAREFVAR